MFKALLKAARLRTLPLAIAGITLGSVVAAYLTVHRWEITWLAISTAVLLQILSNFANDYGDYTKGVDANRTDRAMAAGDLTMSQMRISLMVLGIASLISGIGLIGIAFQTISIQFVLFFLLGLGSLGAAIYYTAGKNPYGYRGLGDLAVFIFFGLAAVSGVYFLHNPELNRSFWLSLLPASAFGFLSAAVLNVNNIRDIHSDQSQGKITLAVKFGATKSIIYQLVLILAAFICLYVFVNRAGDTKAISVFLLLPLYLLHWLKLKSLKSTTEERPLYNKLLKQLVMLNALLVLVFGLILLF